MIRSCEETRSIRHLLSGNSHGCTHDRRVALIEASKTTLQIIDESILELNDQIRNDWGQMSDAAKADAQTALDNLQQRRLAVAEKLGTLEQSSSASWNDIRAGFSTAFADLQKAWESAKQEFETN